MAAFKLESIKPDGRGLVVCIKGPNGVTYCQFAREPTAVMAFLATRWAVTRLGGICDQSIQAPEGKASPEKGAQAYLMAVNGNSKENYHE